MKKDDKASISLVKILVICIIIIALTGLSAMATSTRLNNVKIILSNKYEMAIVTSKLKVSEILEENNITVEDDETVIPNLEEELTDNNTIQIIKKGEEEQEVAQTVEKVSEEEILQNYNTIIEKVETIQEEIPFETITKEATTSSDGIKQNKVLQAGKNGLKEITYRIKYQNDIEIERTTISENIIQEPVNKIIQVSTIQITSRSAQRYTGTNWSYTAEQMDLLCAITAQECSSSYEGSLAVITTACNRAESGKWNSRGTDPLSQYKAQGQFCYSIDSNWKRRLNGNYSDTVKQAVIDALNGKRNHRFLSFRSASTGHYGINIGGNVYFNEM